MILGVIGSVGGGVGAWKGLGITAFWLMAGISTTSVTLEESRTGQLRRSCPGALQLPQSRGGRAFGGTSKGRGRLVAIVDSILKVTIWVCRHAAGGAPRKSSEHCR